MQSQLFHFSSRQRHSADTKSLRGGAAHTCAQRKGGERKSRTAGQRINRPRLEHLSGGGSCGAHLLRVSSKENNPPRPKTQPRIWEEGSDLAAPADRKLNQSSYQTPQLSASVRSRRTSNGQARSRGTRDGLEQLRDPVQKGDAPDLSPATRGSARTPAGRRGLHQTVRRKG